MVKQRREYGEAFSAQGVTVVPEARVISHTNRHFGVAWNRPTAVLVQHAGGMYRIPIFDLTRAIQVGLLLLSGGLLLMTGIAYLQDRRT